MLGQSDWELLGRQIQTLYEASDLDAFPERVLETLAPLIETEISCVTQLAPSRKWALNTSDRPDDEVRALLPALAEFQHEHPRLIDFLDRGREKAATISNYRTKTAWHRTDLYNAFYRPLGLEDQLCIMFPATPEIVMSVVSNRARRSFTDDDRAKLDTLLPHIKLAYQNAMAFERLHQDAETLAGLGGHGVLRVAPDGRILRGGDRARSLLNGHLMRCERVADRLCGSLAVWLQEQMRRPEADRVLRRTTVVGRSGALQVQLIESARQEEWLLVLEEVPEACPTPLDAQVAALPPRTREVLQHLIAGDSEKQVAAKLEISRHTVHDHVKRLHRHFDVAARSELLALFIADA